MLREITYNYPPKGSWIVVDIYRDAKRRGIYIHRCSPTLRGIVVLVLILPNQMDKKKCFFNFFFWNFREMTCNFSLHSQNSEYPRIFQVTGANQNERKLLSTDLVNSYFYYWPEAGCLMHVNHWLWAVDANTFVWKLTMVSPNFPLSNSGLYLIPSHNVKKVPMWPEDNHSLQILPS